MLKSYFLPLEQRQPFRIVSVKPSSEELFYIQECRGQNLTKFPKPLFGLQRKYNLRKKEKRRKGMHIYTYTDYFSFH